MTGGQVLEHLMDDVMNGMRRWEIAWVLND